jgi:predicted RNA-binding Zn ribbon-like protein
MPEGERMAKAREQASWVFDLSGGRLCLDFANTVGGMRGVKPRDHLGSYADLVAFARQTDALGEAHARRLLAEARRRPRDAEAIFSDAVALREALYRVFLARARGGAPAPADLEVVSRALSRALGHRRIVCDGEWCAWSWDEAPAALDAPLWPIADSAASLLTSRDDLARVRVCGMFDEQECSWLFIDPTRAHTKRWCSMKECGNRAKARRHHARAKAADAG